MESNSFCDGNVTDMIDRRSLHAQRDISHSMQMHSSLVRRLSLEKELEGHTGCVNAISWNSSGSLLVSGSDDARINVWSYSAHKLLSSIETGHSTNIFCTKFIPETSDELVVSGAGDAEVRVFNLSRLGGIGMAGYPTYPSALFKCHSRRVKKLAVETGNPNVVWSASEDGTLRQHDFREYASCPPAGSSHQECRNVLLDLRSGARKSLADTPRQLLALKSCDISSTRSHLLLVGGSDAFARLYDRRMLPSLSSSSKKLGPPPCVNYFCPMHLSDRGRSSLHLTHVAFSPEGDEVLLSYSTEHVYLMELNHGSGNIRQYTKEDISKLTSYTPTLNGVELESLSSSPHLNGMSSKSSSVNRLDKCRKLVQYAEKCLYEEKAYFYGIEACNEVLDGYGSEIGPVLMHECLCVRAALLLKRKWKNDAYMAIRDCYAARKIDSYSLKALHLQSESLLQLGKNAEALNFALAAQNLAPHDPAVAETVENIVAQLSAAEAENSFKANDVEPKSDHRALSLSDILYRSEANSDASQDGPRSERDDSDHDEELEFETSASGNEGHEVNPNILHGSLNMRIHKRGDMALEKGRANGSSSSPSLSSRSNRVSYKPEAAVDMKQRYVGHCNVGTDIKQASFLGQKGEYIASGSDDGRWFIWEKKTGRLIKMLTGDEAVVNCIQSHPYDCAVATSGIDTTIKIWTPTASVPSIVAGGTGGPENDNILDTMENNQRKLCRTRGSILPFELLEPFRMRDLADGSLHPFECAQS
ncbi:protein ALTERED SEED GERMINATION 2 [Impatiens glandulifera]|uniref:protein ALTERED SEED GERMINATION 2 n=1 Tax=Impatiens glandulifera TaxID=253017 RepID=UPI001FB05C54|nr:protein ALTERED SEED GERMINATION 2 [Impatiens glandulifera]